LGAPPEIPEGEDSLKNWLRFTPTENYILDDQHKRKRLSSPQDLGAPPEIPEGEDSLKKLA